MSTAPTRVKALPMKGEHPLSKVLIYIEMSTDTEVVEALSKLEVECKRTRYAVPI